MSGKILDMAGKVAVPGPMCVYAITGTNFYSETVVTTDSGDLLFDAKKTVIIQIANDRGRIGFGLIRADKAPMAPTRFLVPRASVQYVHDVTDRALLDAITMHMAGLEAPRGIPN